MVELHLGAYLRVFSLCFYTINYDGRRNQSGGVSKATWSKRIKNMFANYSNVWKVFLLEVRSCGWGGSG